MKYKSPGESAGWRLYFTVGFRCSLLMATTGALLALLGTLTFTNTKIRKKIETSPGLALWDSNEYYGFRFGEKKTPGW